MSGGPPHHPHGRPIPTGNSAWNPLQVPSYFPRQPQHAHMSNEHSMLHPPSWHTPTTEMKTLPPSNIYGLLATECFPRSTPGVDLSLTRNGNQNGEIPATPISLSVRDTNKINSLSPSVLQELTKCTSPARKTTSPKPPSPRPSSPVPKTSPGSASAKPASPKPPSPNAAKPASPGVKGESSGVKSAKRSNIRVDSILERLNPGSDKNITVLEADKEKQPEKASEEPHKEEDSVSLHSNEDSSDGKSRRKRKPSKTVRVSKDDLEEILAKEPKAQFQDKIPERRRSSDDVETVQPSKFRRKTSSESETIDNIAAMVQECVKQKQTNHLQADTPQTEKSEPVPEPTTKDPEKIESNLLTPAQKKELNSFGEIENKLEEMFAGIEEEEKQAQNGFDEASSSQNGKKSQTKKYKRKNKVEGEKKNKVRKKKMETKGKVGRKKKLASKIEAMKDVYAYDSGSNASSGKSRGPFIQIKGPRDSPISVNVVNTPTNDEEDKKANKLKKFHDDSEYRHKVRSKGLHSSTLSNKYDAQTKDVTWICAFCKRGPHATELSGPTVNTSLCPPGDLFGPYFITADCPEFDNRLDDPYDKEFKSRKIVKVLSEVQEKKKKTKRKHSDSIRYSDSESELFLGMTETGNKTYEVWAHEDCIVWSPGVYLVGHRIVGLEEAVWNASNVRCKSCNLLGASICCLKRGCMSIMHMCCARSSDWTFDEVNFKAYCPEHKPQ